MRYVQINAYSGGWADSIIFKKHRELRAQGHESWVFWARGDHEQDEYMQKIASKAEVCFDALQTRIDGRASFHSKRITRRLLARLEEINPDVVHLHVLLGYYINIEMLFKWLASHHCGVVWTLHDCWAFTGHCYHFTYVNCGQWRSGCACKGSCPQVHEYPETIFGGNRSVRWNYEQKKRLFTMLPVERLRLIAPSQWLADLVAQSFLNKYPITVERNTVDTSVYHPMESNFKEIHGLEGKFMILGVASKWSERKGLFDFGRLAFELDPGRFAVVVVGLTEKQIERMRGEYPNVIALPRTSSLTQLVEIYSAADVFFNPTLEDNYPTVNLEAQACGTPVITYDTGGCGETLELPESCTVGGFDEACKVIGNLKSSPCCMPATNDSRPRSARV